MGYFVEEIQDYSHRLVTSFMLIASLNTSIINLAWNSIFRYSV